TSGTCGGLTIVGAPQDHHTIEVTGTIGIFTVHVTGVGQLDNAAPTLENLNQIDASAAGPGTLTAVFSDRGFTQAASSFDIATSHVTDIGIAGSTIDFTAFVDGTNSIPAIDLIGAFSETGHSQSSSGIFANPDAGLTPYSLTSQTVITFAGTGTVQANITI